MKLPIVSGLKVKKALLKVGFTEESQSGSHVKLFNSATKKIVIVPMHLELAKGTLLSIITQSGLSREEFLEMLK